jgi:hypothetical protein
MAPDFGMPACAAFVADRQRRLERDAGGATLDGELVFPVAHRSVWFDHDRSIAVVVGSSGLDPVLNGGAPFATRLRVRTPSVPHRTTEAEDRHRTFYDAWGNLPSRRAA